MRYAMSYGEMICCINVSYIVSIGIHFNALCINHLNIILTVLTLKFNDYIFLRYIAHNNFETNGQSTFVFTLKIF